MASVIKIKRSAGSVAPTTLQFGELAYTAGSDASKLYFGTGVDTGGGAMQAIAIGGKYYTDKIESGVTIGSTNIAIGGTSTTVAGLTSVGFTGSTSGASTLTASAVAGTTAFVLPASSGTLVGSGDTGTVTNAMLAGSIANAKLVNSSFTLNGTIVALGDSVTMYGNLTVEATPATNAFGNLTYNGETGVLTLTKVTQADIRGTLSGGNAAGEGYGSLAYDSATGAFTFTKVTTADIRAQFSAGTGVTITDGVVAIGQAVGTTDNVTFNNVTVSGTLSSDDITAASISIAGSAVITGDLTVQGTTTTVNSTAVAISDINLTLAKDATTAAQADGAGLTVSGANATLTYASTGDKWVFNKQVEANVTGALTGNASSATILQTSRDFSVSGDVTTAAAVPFNGSANVTLAVTLTDSAVITSKIADNAVTTVKILNDAITAAKMADGSVELATATVTGTLPVANGGTGATTFTAGRLLLGDGTNPVTTDAGLAWDGATDTLTVGGATMATGVDGTVTFSTTTANADIIIAPNGTGSVTIATNSIIFDSEGDGVVESAVGDSMTVRGDTGLTLDATAGDIVMELAASDANKVTISGPTAAQYSTGITDNDLVTAHWVNTVALDGGTY